MSNSNYVSGRKFEYLVRDMYESYGYFVARTAGSKGPFDLIAWKIEHGRAIVELVQCKKEKKKGNHNDAVEEFRKVPIQPEHWRRMLWVKRGKNIYVKEVLDNDVVDMETLTLKDVKEKLAE